jgi:hypothetical protein
VTTAVSSDVTCATAMPFKRLVVADLLRYPNDGF